MIEKYISEAIAQSMTAAALTLIFVLFYRLITLDRKEQFRQETQTSLQSGQSWLDLQAFAKNQLNDFRSENGEFNFTNDEAKVGLASYYLIGAAEFVGKQDELTSNERRMVVIKLLQTDLGLCAKQVSKFYAGAKAICSTSSKDNPVRTGAKAFKIWLDKESVCDHLTLSNLLA